MVLYNLRDKNFAVRNDLMTQHSLPAFSNSLSIAVIISAVEKAWDLGCFRWYTV